MQKYKRFAKIIAGFMAVLFVVGGAFMSQTGSITANAETPAEKTASGANFDVFIDADINVCIVTNDKKKSSNIYNRLFNIERSV